MAKVRTEMTMEARMLSQGSTPLRGIYRGKTIRGVVLRTSMPCVLEGYRFLDRESQQRSGALPVAVDGLSIVVEKDVEFPFDSFLKTNGINEIRDEDLILLLVKPTKSDDEGKSFSISLVGETDEDAPLGLLPTE